MNWHINNQDVAEWVATYSGDRFHALLCDPPYEIGFQGESWDKSGIAFDPSIWNAMASHLHPGAFGMAFASARGWHRLACAIEDANLIIHPSIFGWGTSKGSPKSSPIADDRFKSHRYGQQSLKPALEPIIVFQKPYEGQPLTCIRETGAGTLNIDSARIGYGDLSPEEVRKQSGSPSKWPKSAGWKQMEDYKEAAFHPLGRWPTNLILREQLIAKNKNVSRFFYLVQSRIHQADPLYYASRESGRKKHDGSAMKNSHPTVKPIDLGRYLAALLLPPADFAPRRLLVPFAGSGSEMIGADLAGWDWIEGIEKNKEYADVAAKRMAYWHNKSSGSLFA